MTVPSPAKLLKAKDLLQHSWCSGDLVRARVEGENEYCALGAIGKAHGLSDQELRGAYESIPIEDVIVLANVIDPSRTKQVLEDIKKGGNLAIGSLYQTVYTYNDRMGKKATLERFSQACKEYKDHLPMVEKFKKATENRQGKVAFAYDD